MKQIVYILSVFLLLSAFSSCEETAVEPYTGAPYVSFYAADNYYLKELQSYDRNFVYSSADRTRDTVWVKLIARASIPTRDYRIAIRAYHSTSAYVEDRKDAEPGVHYVPFDSEEMQKHLIFHKGNMYDSIPIILLRDPSLKTEGYRLTIRVADSDEIKAADQLPDDNEDHTYVVIYTADTYIKPLNWDWSNLRVGVYGPEKHKFMIEHSDGARWDYDFISKLDDADKLYYAYKFYNDLEEYNRTHDKPLTEADGSRVIFTLK